MATTAQTFSGNMKWHVENGIFREGDVVVTLLIDSTGRLASQIATVVQGKDNQHTQPYREDGDMHYATSQLLMFNGRNVYDNGNNDDGNGSSGNAKSNGRLSDASACDLSLGEEGEYSMGSTIESGVPPWTGKSSEIIKEKITKSSSRIHKSLPYRTGHGFPRRANSSDSLSSLFLKKPTSSQVATFNQMKG
ncbi:hypothetical protein HPP92_011486 [Vanilla planifolia]|uniref:Uncharacterized protein n=1 Tax=Vanilla planifolia TaxID=51239 RepID=A0A835QZ63_VANPL|nr:hypothetical protein HPP92_011486 [Vanilla planifolia]